MGAIFWKFNILQISASLITALHFVDYFAIIYRYIPLDHNYVKVESLLTTSYLLKLRKSIKQKNCSTGKIDLVYHGLLILFSNISAECKHLYCCPTGYVSGRHLNIKNSNIQNVSCIREFSCSAHTFLYTCFLCYS